MGLSLKYKNIAIAHACNPSTQEAEAEGCEFEDSFVHSSRKPKMRRNVREYLERGETQDIIILIYLSLELM